MAVSDFKRQLRRSPIVRRAGIPVYRAYADVRAVPRSDPPVLANSIPKAGTHLLTSLLSQLPRSTYSGRHYELDQFEVPCAWSQTGEYDFTAAATALRSIKAGQYMSGHFPAHPPIIKTLEKLDFRCVFIVRDPRDVVVSTVYYILGHPYHPLKPRYLSEFGSVEEMILGTIKGRPPLGPERGWRSIGEELARYGGWLRYENGYVVRFEDLVGEKGSGDGERQRAEVSNIASFVGRPLSSRRSMAVAESIWGRGSATFRKGEAGDWRRHFTEVHRHAFKEEAGQHLIELGYERSMNW